MAFKHLTAQILRDAANVYLDKVIDYMCPAVAYAASEGKDRFHPARDEFKALLAELSIPDSGSWLHALSGTDGWIEVRRALLLSLADNFGTVVRRVNP